MNEIVDSAAFQRVAEVNWNADHGLVLARLSFDSLGDRRVTIISRSLPETVRLVVQEGLEAASPERGTPRERFEFFLADSVGPSVRRVAGLPECAPRLLNADWLAERLAAERRAGRANGGETVRVMVYVNPDGTVGPVEIRESSGNPNADRAAARVLQGAMFEPARLAEIPIGTWVSLPITFRNIP